MAELIVKLRTMLEVKITSVSIDDGSYLIQRKSAVNCGDERDPHSFLILYWYSDFLNISTSMALHSCTEPL